MSAETLYDPESGWMLNKKIVMVIQINPILSLGLGLQRSPIIERTVTYQQVINSK